MTLARATSNSASNFQSPLVVALDIGTSSTRAIAFDAAGRKVGRAAQRAYAQSTTPDGGVETDADALLELTALCLDELLLQLDAAGVLAAPPVAVATSCFWHSLLGVGPDGRPRTPLFSWADNRAAPWLEPLRAALDEDAAHARTGCVLHTSYWPAKLLWLAEARPELFDAARGQTRWMSFGEYLELQLFGQARVSLSMASGTGLFHQNDCRWDATMLAALPLDESHLSPLCDADEPLNKANELRSPWRERWPALRDAKWFPALGDGACSNIGSGCADASSIALNAGTSGALRVVLQDHERPAPRGLWRYRIDRRRSVLGGALSNAGNVWAWAHSTLGLPDDAEAQIAAMPPDAHGLTVLPFLAGERSPLWDARARFAVVGAGLDTTSVEILRACLEAVSLRFALVARQVQAVVAEQEAPEAPAEQSATGAAARPIVASGGALDRSLCWRHIMCDCLGVPLLESLEVEASARGAALMAFEACGIINDVAGVAHEQGAPTLPHPEHFAVFERALARQNELSQQLFGTAMLRVER